MKLSRMSLLKNHYLLPSLFIFVSLLLLFFVTPNSALAAQFSCPLTIRPYPEINPDIINFSFDTTDQVKQIKQKIKDAGTGFLQFRFSEGVDCLVNLATINNIDDVDLINFVNSGSKTYLSYDVSRSSFMALQCGDIFSAGRNKGIDLFYDGGIDIELCSEQYQIKSSLLSCSVKTLVDGEEKTNGLTSQDWKLEIFAEDADITVDSIFINGLKINQTWFEVRHNRPWLSNISNNNLRVGTHNVTVQAKRSRIDTDYQTCGSISYEVLSLGQPTPTPLPTLNPNISSECKDKFEQSSQISIETFCSQNPECSNNYAPCVNLKNEKSSRQEINPRAICEQLSNTENRSLCFKCFDPQTYGDTPEEKSKSPGSWTALGCIPTDTAGFVKWLLGPFMGIAGGIAFLLILKGGYQIMFSQGNPESITDGRDTIVAAVSGLVVIILSIAILEIIGVDILGLPGFGR